MAAPRSSSWAPVLVFVGIVGFFSLLSFFGLYLVTPEPEPEEEKGKFWKTIGKIASTVVGIAAIF